MARVTVPLPTRYTFLLFELGALFTANHVAFGSWLPSSDPTALWFYAALFGLLLGQRLDTPFFTTPKDSVLYAIPAFIAVLQISDPAWGSAPGRGEGIRWLLVGWISLVLAVSSVAIWLHGSNSERGSRASAAAAHLSSALGNPRAFFSVVLLLLLVAFPPASIEGLLVIAAVWALSVPFSLLDFLYALARRVSVALIVGGKHIQAEVASFQLPGLVVLRTSGEHNFLRGTIVAYRAPSLEVRLATVLGHMGQDSGALSRAIDLGIAQGQRSSEARAIDSMQATTAPLALVSDTQRALADAYGSTCIGVVAPESEIGRLLIDVTTELDLSAGRLVRAACGPSDAYYQITNGLTKEDIVQQKNTFGFIAAHAKTVGRWNASEARFLPATWIPSPNAPVSLVQESENTTFELSQVGTFPNTDFGVRIRNPHQLVTHNTAILGILGVGKSMLAMELIERTLGEGCKVIALDLTDQYEEELGELFDPTYNAGVVASLQAVSGGKTKVSLNVEEGGARVAFADQVHIQITSFMASEHKLLILNPAAFDIWRQDSRPYNNTASMARLSSCEVTQIISDAALGACQRMGRTDAARLWLVYEEAHSLIPEWNAAVADGDRAASNGTGRAILQGRKYGLGCLLITQRTASVTKTILNQCNTIFAMRSFDDTSKEFLSNYIGRDYAALLPSLPERHAVFFGRASSCENPVHICLNDRTRFINACRGSDSKSMLGVEELER